MTYSDPSRYRSTSPGFGTAGNYGSGAPVATQRGRAPQPQRHRRGGGLSGALRYSIGFVVVIWAVHIINLVFFDGGLLAFGIRPMDTSSLWGIVTAPLLHASFEHLISNTVPGAVFAFLVGFSGRRAFWEVTAIVVLVAGVGTWLFGGVGTNHIGASSLVYGWLAYLLVRGIFNRSFRQILLGLVLGFFYSGLVWGLLPGTPGMSWQGHLFGAIGGILAGMMITSDDPPKLVGRRNA
ncbi:rhomboid family intramembrane serine protease [Corynebacterium yudongzhengii]|uniref:Rhomboid family intramembrane serine protease n=1 Tax=Corynebacterium yudongzhengii TaxID=2080740 RepID=A0A2U1T8S9_9CORY|nr:rhomboid family intramembrane serine protease [Corynebacterium yudongzhengii]AWB82552.1 rhomboid family intramembrane serine protease [Corynebacterium yudongzhengii]PWC02392.1 rhomboid family intramembrane serine protease [Corynebacterium yudongzhengii]